MYEILPHYKDFKYGLIQGLYYLREAFPQIYPYSTQDSFVVTNGASEALDMTLRVICNYDVAEWCQDWYQWDYYLTSPNENPPDVNRWQDVQGFRCAKDLN